MAIQVRYPTLNTAVFTNASNAHADDGVYATAAPGRNAALTEYWYGFGFDIPSDATIDRVKIEVKFKVDTADSVATLYLQAARNGVLQGSYVSNTAEPTTDMVVTNRSTGSWTPAQLNDNGQTGLNIAVQAHRGSSDTAVTFSIGYVKATVDYLPAGTVRSRVSQSADDGTCYVPNQNPLRPTDADFFMGVDSFTRPRNGWLRFVNVLVPPGSTINNAYITFAPYNNSTRTYVRIKIFAEASANPTAPSSRTDYDGRALSTNSSAWTIPAWTYGEDANSPDISTIIQEVIDQSGWASGNAILIVTQDNGSTNNTYRQAYSYDGSPANAPALTIEYTEPSGAPASFSGQTVRRVTVESAYTGQSRRVVTASADTQASTRRAVSALAEGQAQTRRVVTALSSFAGQTKRTVHALAEYSAQTVRNIIAGLVASYTAQLVRRVSKSDSVSAQTRRVVTAPAGVINQARRRVTAGAAYDGQTKRTVSAMARFVGATRRSLSVLAVFIAQTMRRVKSAVNAIRPKPIKLDGTVPGAVKLTGTRVENITLAGTVKKLHRLMATVKGEKRT